MLGEVSASSGPPCSPQRAGMELLSAGTGCGARRQPGGCFGFNRFPQPFLLYCRVCTCSGHGRRGGDAPLRAGSSGGMQPGLCLPCKWCWTNPGCRARKATVNHRSLTGCFSLSPSVCFTFFDSWTMKCFLGEYVPFEMHILKSAVQHKWTCFS